MMLHAQPIGISGYPFGEPVLVTNSGSMATSWSTAITEVSLPGAPFRIPHIADVYLADVEANPGNSGGPVYLTENATVKGMCVGSKCAPIRDETGEPVVVDNRRLFHATGVTVVVPTRYMIEMLNKNSVQY